MGLPSTTAVVLAALLLMAAGTSTTPASAEIATPCTASFITSFAPCLFYLTGGGVGAWSSESPTADCCAVVGELLRSSAECACLIINGNVPFALPFNRTLAVALPGACNSEDVSLIQCKGVSIPLPAPGPISFGPGLPPFRDWPSLLPPPSPVKRQPLVPSAADTALAPSGLARKERPQLEYNLASAVEPLRYFYRGTLLVSMAISGVVLLLSRL